MRKRNVQILFRLNDEEAAYLYELVERSGHSKEALLRSMLMGYRLCEKPDPEFYKIMRELSAIGNRINQLAVWLCNRSSTFWVMPVQYAPYLRTRFQRVKRKFAEYSC